MEDKPGYSDEKVLTAELKRGKEDAFDYLFRANYKELCRFAVTFISDQQLAEDLVQDVFFSVWQKRKTIDESKSVISYLFVSVRNACYSFLRSQRENVGIEALMDEVIPPEKIPDFENSQLAELWRMVEALPYQCKNIFKLVVMEDMKYNEVASLLNISVNTVKTQIKIAYRTLREKIGPVRELLLFFFAGKNGTFADCDLFF